MGDTVAEFFAHRGQFFNRLGDQACEPPPDLQNNQLPENKSRHVDDIRVMRWRVPEKANCLHNDLEHEVCFQTQHNNPNLLAERSVLVQPLQHISATSFILLGHLARQLLTILPAHGKNASQPWP